MGESVEVREARDGEASLVAHFYFRLFQEQFDFLPGTEAYFLRAAAELYDDPEGNRIWVIEDQGEVCGSISIVHTGDDQAQLRLFGISPSLQGRGAGSALMRTAMEFCAARGYSHVRLWTIDICAAARHLYARWGFRLTDTKRNTTWADYPMMEELWEYSSDPLVDASIPVVVPAGEHLEDFGQLVHEYTDGIKLQGDDVLACLTSQRLDDELGDLRRKYGGSAGAMFVAYVDGRPAGSIAITRNDDESCEVKRLYVRPEFRGRHLGKVLLDRAIEEARRLGYRFMRLDTFPFMEGAIRMYEQYGFERVDRYNDNPAASAIFMCLEL